MTNSELTAAFLDRYEGLTLFTLTEDEHARFWELMEPFRGRRIKGTHNIPEDIKAPVDEFWAILGRLYGFDPGTVMPPRGDLGDTNFNFYARKK